MTAPDSGPQLIVLGTGTSVGVPCFYCGCKACAEARVNTRAARTSPGLAIAARDAQGRKAFTLIDASPDLRHQLLREGIGDVARVLLTHEHYDHTGGLAQLEFFAKLHAKAPVPLYAGPEALAAVERQFDFMADALQPNCISAGQALAFDGIRFTPLPATHSPGAFGYIIEGPTRAVAYFPDTGPLPAATLERLQGIDTLIVDATFNGSNWMPRSHQTNDDAIALGAGLNAKTTWLTHLAMHYDTPITLSELEAKLAPLNGAVQAAYDGLKIDL